MAFGDRFHGASAKPSGPRKRGGFGSAYTTVQQQPRKTKKKGRHGVLGLVENLGEDISTSIMGIPAGIVDTAEHPIRTGKQIAKSYKDTYGPLAHGDVSKFLHNLYSHPLGPALDALTIATLGAGGFAKGGQIAAEAGIVSKTSRIARAGDRAELVYHAPRPGETVSKLTHTNPLIKARQLGLKKILDKLPYEAPHIGEAARYAREAQRIPRGAAMSLIRSKEAREYRNATRHLTDAEFAAVHLVGNDLHPLDLRDALVKLRDEGSSVDPVMFKVLENPKVNEAFDKIMAGDKRLHRAVDAADRLSLLDRRVKMEHGILTNETADARIAKHRPFVQDLISGDLRPTPDKPFYVPDVDVHRRVSNPEMQKYGGGAGVARNIVKQNRGTLLRLGQLALSPDLLGPEFLRTVKYGLVDDIHATLMSGAARVSAEEARAGRIPKGYELIPKEIIAKSGGKRSQQIHPLLRRRPEAVRQAERTLPLEEHLGDSFTVRDLKDAATLHGDYLIVPTSLKREMVGEFHRSTSAVRKFLDAPTKVWRALVLGFRVGFLTNNLVGNHLLYALHAAGPAGLRAYLNAVKRTHGDSMVKRLLTDREIPEALRQDFMREFFPEQIEGTFGRTQSPSLEDNPLKRQVSGHKARKVGRLSTGLLPATQAVAEGNLRRALVETMVRKSPEFKKVYGSMGRDTRTFEAAAQQVLKQDGPRPRVLATHRDPVTNSTTLASLPDAWKLMPKDDVHLYHATSVENFDAVKSTGLIPGKDRPGETTGVYFAQDGAALLSLLPRGPRSGVIVLRIKKGSVPTHVTDMFEPGSGFEEHVAPDVVPPSALEYAGSDGQWHPLVSQRNYAYQRMISERVNNVLGDYLNMTPFERNVMRGLFPFYGWYRAIMRITTHLALDTPGRANLLQKIGQVGAEQTMETLGEIPDYLRGLLPIGQKHAGTHEVLSTAGINPFLTVTQLGAGATGVLTGKPGDTGRAFTQLGPNPLLLAGLENLAGKDFFSGRDLKGGPGGIPGAVLRNVFAELPQTRLVQRPESKLYGRPSQRDAILAYLGVPIKNLNLARAHHYAGR